MSRNQINWQTCFLLAVTSVGCLTFIANQATAQDAQAQATADNARERLKADTTANAPLPATKDSLDPKKKSPAENAENLKRRAGERVGQDPRGRSHVLGMHLQESPDGGVKVVEVAAASPAFDAGIKEGDVLVSFAGFQGNNYRKWIDGMSRLAKEADDNSQVSIVLMRAGQRVDAQIRVPENHVGPVSLPLGPLPQQAPPQGVAIGVGVQAGPAPGGNVAIENVGPFGNFFGGDTSPAAEHAMAELHRVGGAPRPAAIQQNPNGPAGPAPDQNARVGLAGFRGGPDGMMVMVDVGGLPPGNYLVAITDPGFAGVTEPTSAPPVPGPANPAVPQSGPGGRVPVPVADPAQPPVGPQSQTNIPRTILAQVADNAAPAAAAPGTTIPPTGQVNPLTAPPTGEVNPLTAPPTGQVNPTNTTPTGQSAVNNALNEQARQATAARANAGANGAPVQNQIGTLTVDQSGTGRMQQNVEALRVRDVVGQAIVLYSQAQPQQNTLPANLNPAANPNGGNAVNNPTQPGAASAPNTRRPNAATREPANAGGLPPTAPQPVAAGIIRLLSDRRPQTTIDRPADVFDNPPVQQPANNTPPAATNPIR